MIEQFRTLLRSVDPRLLTTDDRVALLKLVGACFDADNQTAGGGGLVALHPDRLMVRRCRSSSSSSVEYSDSGTRTDVSTPASAAVM